MRRRFVFRFRGLSPLGLRPLAFCLAAASLVAAPLMLSSLPSQAATPSQKAATCKFGADDQKLQGAARNAFLKKCMANKNDPRGTTPGTPPPPGSPAATAAAPKQ